MSERVDGGPAFPPNMTLRDWFAGQALVGLLSDASGGGDYTTALTIGAYQIADAMLSARAR